MTSSTSIHVNDCKIYNFQNIHCFHLTKHSHEIMFVQFIPNYPCYIWISVINNTKKHSPINCHVITSMRYEKKKMLPKSVLKKGYHFNCKKKLTFFFLRVDETLNGSLITDKGMLRWILIMTKLLYYCFIPWTSVPFKNDDLCKLSAETGWYSLCHA